MYSGFKGNSVTNRTLASDPSETQLEVLQRQVDNYTRKLEQEKRKYFSIQDTFKSVNEEYAKEKDKLNRLKKESAKASNLMLQAKLKNLQANLDKAISMYDDTVAHNNQLKNQIDMLRREKKNYRQIQGSLQEQISRLEEETKEKLVLIERKKKRSEELKEQILQIRVKNDAQKEQYLKQFDSLEKQYLSDKRDRQNLKHQKPSRPESIDTQPLLRLRLKRMVASNRDRVKTIEQYRKHMGEIEEAFNEIKAKSGISSLEGVTSTFIKSEEQNHSLYNYMDELSREIDSLEDQNADLEAKIARRKEENQQKTQLLSGESEEAKERARAEDFLRKKNQQVAELNQMLKAIQPVLTDTLKELAMSKLGSGKIEEGIVLTERNVEEYLAQLEDYISKLLAARQGAKTKVVKNIKESTTAYSRPLPVVSYDEIVKEKGEESGKFIEENKFREYAQDYWERRKGKEKQ